MREAWHVLEPANPYIHGWHVDAIAEHLEAISYGDIRNLVINMPPRHMKSLLVSVFWPVWEWIAYPARRWLFASYSQSLSTRDSLKCRRLIDSPWFQRNFGDRFTLTSDQNQKTRFENDKTGYRIATSVGGIGTGEGGDRIIVDDPHNVQEGESEAKRLDTLLWWNEAMSTRGNDPKTVARVIVMQRVHAEDLSGHVLAQGGYEHLCLPARFEGNPHATGIGWSDPRTEEGELLCPQRFGERELAELESRLGAVAAAGQLQQQPVPRGGAMFKDHWFHQEDALPADLGGWSWARYWDKAGAAPGKGDWTVGVLMGRDPRGLFWIADVARFQSPADERNKAILETAKRDNEQYKRVKTYIEQPPGLAKESTETVVRLLAGFDVEADPVHRDKAERAEPFAAQCLAGNVRMLKAPWNAPYLAVMTLFPRGAHDDDVDASSGAFNRLTLAAPQQILSSGGVW